jgi:hypothetical protein
MRMVLNLFVVLVLRDKLVLKHKLKQPVRQQEAVVALLEEVVVRRLLVLQFNL